MIWYRLKRRVPKEIPHWNEDTRVYFKKDGSSQNVGTFYATHEAAVRALNTMHKGHEKYEIIAFEVREVDE